MKISETEKFRKSLNSLQTAARKKAQKQFKFFVQNLFHPSLRTEKLEPKSKNLWSFRIDKNHRVIFTGRDNYPIFISSGM